MRNKTYNLQFEKLCKAFDLGEIVFAPEPIFGGLMHKMFALQTTNGKYAIKALNPQIMLRPTAMKNIIDSENIADIAAKSISAVPAVRYNGKAIQEIDGQYYLIFNFLDGKSLTHNEITIAHCEKISTVLSDLHNIVFSELGLSDNYSSEEKLVDWSCYLQKGIKAGAAWVDVLRKNTDKLYEWNQKVIISAKSLSKNTVISHGDLEPKNVIWNEGMPIIIDWEAAGFIHPAFDLLETAIYWANDGYDNIDRQKFIAFINSYKKRNPEMKFDFNAALQKSYSGRLGWLEYSLKRSLLIECSDDAEQQMGSEHVFGTINSLLKYSDSIVQLEEWALKVES